MDIRDFISKYGILTHFSKTGFGIVEDGWEHNKFDVIVKLADGTENRELEFEMLAGMKTSELTSYDVMTLLRSVESTWNGDTAEGFREYCEEFVVDPDSRKELEKYKATGEEVTKLKKFLGPLWDEFLTTEDVG